MEFFVEKAQKATFTCESYEVAFKQARKGAVIYCDPPYVPLSKTASFTTYAKDGFNLDEQKKLAELARDSADRKGVPVLISNHANDVTLDIYQQSCQTDIVEATRTISHKGEQRNRVEEIFALYLIKG